MGSESCVRQEGQCVWDLRVEGEGGGQGKSDC